MFKDLKILSSVLVYIQKYCNHFQASQCTGEIGENSTNNNSTITGSISKDGTQNSLSAGSHPSGMTPVASTASISNNPASSGSVDAPARGNNAPATSTGTTENKYPAATLNVHPLLSSMVVYTHPLKFQGFDQMALVVCDVDK